MEIDYLKKRILNIVAQATALKNKHIDDRIVQTKNAPVNYACIFSQSEEEYNELVETVLKIGKVIKETQSGLLFHIEPLDTTAGKLRILKIRLPDNSRPELGDADFTILTFPVFKKEYLVKKGFKLIQRENFEMIELMDSEFDVRVYFSNPPLDKQLGIDK